MLYYHCRLRLAMRRLLSEMGHELIGIGTLDRGSTQQVPPNPNLSGFDHFADLRDHPANGIVRPTKHAIQIALDQGVDILVRTGQDMVLTNLPKACRQICQTPENALVGGADVCTNIKGHLSAMGIKQIGDRYKFVQGNWLQATTKVWAENYLRLPDFIRHYCDDSLFSYLLEMERNGKLCFTPGAEIIHKHRRGESAMYFDSLLPDAALTPARTDMQVLVLYRYIARTPEESAWKLRFLASFANQLAAFSGHTRIPARLFLIADNTPEAEENKCREVLAGIDHRLISTKSVEQKEMLSGGRSCTPKHYTLYLTSMQLVKQHADDRSVILFVEDDYLFRPDALSKTVEFVTKFPRDFVAPMDHPDRYDEVRRQKELTDHYHPYRLELIWQANHHWRSCVSTCHTFATTLEGLRLNARFLLDADQQRGDHTMWCDVWRNGHSRLWSPVPGLASHRGGPKLDDWRWEELLPHSGAIPDAKA